MYHSYPILNFFAEMRIRYSCLKHTFCVLTVLSMLGNPVFAQDIFQAIRDGSIDQLKSMLLKNDEIVNTQDNDKNTPLHYAASRGSIEMVELLVASGASPNTPNYQGFTPLHQAASQGHLEVTQALIAHGADIHVRTERGRTPLFLVAMNNGNVDLARMLLDAGADVNTQENSGATPLTYAPFRGFGDLIDVLLDHGAEVRVDTDLWFEVFHRACSIGHKRLAEVMIESGLDIQRKNEDGRAPLHSAAEGGAFELVTFLIEQGNSVNSRDYCGATPLHFAAASGHLHVVDTLIELGAAIDAKNGMGETPFNLASQEERWNVVERLIERGADQNPPQFPVVRGAYLGQSRPGRVPEVFGPGLVSAYAPIHGCVTFTPDGHEMYWAVVDFQKRGSTIYHMKLENGQWTKPEPPTFASHFSDDVPFCAPNGEKMYLLTNRPVEEGGSSKKENIWVIDREGNGWGNAQPIGPAVNLMDLHWQFSVTNDGTIYFASSEGIGMGLNDIYRSRCVNGEYQEPQNMGDAINSAFPDFAPYISPDESYLIFTSLNRTDGSGLYVSFKKRDGVWTQARYMGEAVGDGSLLTTMSPDGKYLFFTGRREGRKGVFWVDAKIIDEFRP